MADDESVSEIEQRLAENSAYFDSLVELIPAKYYFPDNEEEKHGKFYKNRGQKAPKQALKEASKKAKRSRLDPSQQKSVLELQQEDDYKQISESTKTNTEEIEPSFSVEKVKSTGLDDLRSRLHQRIENLRGKRKAHQHSSKPSHMERPKKKSKSEVKNNKKSKIVGSTNNDKAKNLVRSSNKQVLNENGEVVFSKFDFTRDHHNYDITSSSNSGSKANNYKKLLAKAEARKKKLADLKAADADKAKEMQQKLNWKNAIEKAEGVKQKNDPSLLKKTIKRKEKLKQKHRKEWKERTDSQKKQMDERQKLRKKHIQERVDAKKSKNMNKGKKRSFKKKGHKPGF